LYYSVYSSLSHSFSTVAFLLFFFSSYGSHRDLHSFPTRRSSDLWWISELIHRPTKTRSLLILTLGIGFTIPRHPKKHGSIKPMIDRKSTRLNSSHVKISYAVFCLKKKKKKQHK